MRQATAFLLIIVAAADVQASVILDFEAFRQEDNLIHDHPGILHLNGFTLTSVPPPNNAFRFSTVGTQHPVFPGSTALFNGQSNAENILTATDRSPFSIASIALAVLPPGADDPNGPFDPGPFDITFFGTTADGGTVSNTFTINNTFLALETFTFTGFENVLSVSWLQGSGFNPPGPPGPNETPAHQFDNLVLGPAITATVPEPTSLLVFAVAGVIAAGFKIRSSRIQQARR